MGDDERRSWRNRLWRVFHRDPIERWLRGNYDTWLESCEELDERYVAAVVFIWQVMDSSPEIHNCNGCIACRARQWLYDNNWPPNMAGTTGPSHVTAAHPTTLEDAQ